MSDSATRNVNGHRVRVTSLDREVFPDAGVTKRDVLDYYERIAAAMTQTTRARAATRKRWTQGVGSADAPLDAFFHKDLDDDAPSWMRSYAMRHEDHTNRYPLLNDAATLLWFAQRGTVEFHVPQWRFGTRGKELPPDRLVFDLDPGEGAGLGECVEVATAIRERIARDKRECVPVTSGSKGIHLYAPLSGNMTCDEATEYAHAVAEDVEHDLPTLAVSNMRRERRQGRVLIDWSQNRRTKTTVAPYSLRGRPGATVAWPRQWRDVDDPGLAQVTFAEAMERAGETPQVPATLAST